MSTNVSSVVSHFPDAENGFTTTTASTISSGAATVPLNSIAGYTNGEPVVFVIEPSSATAKQTFTGIVDTAGVQVTSVVWTAGTNQSHAAGSTVVDYATATHIAMMSKGIKVNHTQKGNHKTLTDDSANEWIGQTSAASAVNYVDVANSATGNAPIISAKGDDSNVGLTLTPKGTGAVKMTSNYDAWVSGLTAPSTVTALGNRSYSVVINSTDYTDRLSAGMRIRTTRTVAAPTQCTSLNGTTQYWVKTSPSAMTFTNNFVVSAWIKLSSYNGSQMVIASRYNGTSGWMFLLNASGQVRLDGYNAGSSNFASSLSYQSVPLNKWVHVAAQLDMTTTSTGGTNNYIMIDGVEVPNAVSRGGTNPTALVQAGNLEIGGQNGGTTPFPGKIAQVAIYNAKVTEANVLATISQGLSGSETSLISAYSFNNSTNDLSANANNLSAGAGSPTATNADSPFGGQADGTISSTLDYAEILSATFSTNTTLTVRVPDTNTIPTTGGISALSYSTQYSPYGCPRIENIGGHIPSLASFSTASTTAVVMSGATIGVYIPAGRRVKITAVGSQFFNSGAAQSTIGLYAGASASALTTVLQSSTAGANTAAGTYPVSTSAIYTNTTAGTVYFSLALNAAASGTSTIGNAAMWVEYA